MIGGDFEVIRVRDKGPGINEKNSFASPTPIVGGDRIYVHFGFYGTACVSAGGELLWRQTLKYEPQHGPGGSPVLFEDLLIFSCDGFDVQFVVALDSATGKIRWKTARGKGNQAYTTPLLIEVDGKPQVISPGAIALTHTIHAVARNSGSSSMAMDSPTSRQRFTRTGSSTFVLDSFSRC